METIMAVLVASVAAGYFTIAAVVAPRIRMPSVSDRLVLVVRAAAIAFFIGCGMTHVHIFVHTVGLGTPQPVEFHELVFHFAQAIGAWLFIIGAALRLELHVVPSQSRAELKAAVERQRELARRAQELAERDELTGLARRRRFEEELARTAAQARRHGTPAALLLVDVDGLKSINDNHGHRAGDALLADLGRTIGAALRTADLPARIGGDEFAVILPDTALPEAETVARKVVALFDTDLQGVPRPADGQGATVSVGAAAIEGLPGDAMEDADVALYRAKRSGGNTFAVAPSRLASAPASG
jgi:diguanylate cyclase (GGDEF)-like protein